jgi:osmoprotectant transport system ATP-binding protein
MPPERPQRGATVEFRHVTKQYGRSTGNTPAAVNDLSLTVPPGEICVLVGPSGCGKTTTLKMVNRLVEPTSGQVLIDGQDVTRGEVTALRRRIGYVIQQTGLFPHRTVAQNVATVPRLLGWSADRVRARVDELLVLIGLDPERVRDRYPSQLSGGERQRVGVARAMAAEPPVMLMDEPFGAVDPIVRERLQNEFLRLHRQLGTTVLLVTHDIDEAIKMGDRVAVMQQGGHLAQYAPPAELLARPANEFVARFVGADRGLKRLALIRVADVRTRAAPASYVLLLDAEQRPIGWVSLDRLGSDGTLTARAADPSSPVFTADTTLRDAVSMLLTSTVQTGVIVDADGRYRGVVSLDTVATALRPSPVGPDSVDPHVAGPTSAPAGGTAQP